MYLSSIDLELGAEVGYPFDLPAFEGFKTLDFTSNVTFFVGANASGKSTMLESLAMASDRIVIGGKDLKRDDSLDALRSFVEALQLSWTRRTRKGFFLRAEDFFNFIRKNKDLSNELQNYADDLEGYDFAQRALLNQKHAIDNRYGDLNAKSHGEGFLQVFQSRMVAGGLYLLDEPEAALSPQSQLALLYQIRKMVEGREAAQFIIATHSPILMAYPNAQILSFGDDGIKEERYDELEHVFLYKRFLADPARFVESLFREE